MPRHPAASFRVEIVRVVLTVAAAIAFLLMHGLDPSDTARAHFAYPATSMVDSNPATASHVAFEPSSSGSTDQREPLGGEMVGCVFVLLVLIGFLGLRKLYSSLARSSPDDGVSRRYRDGPARAPPVPVFVVHCVFRL